MSPRILIVDDEPSLVRGLTYALERELFEVEVARDGLSAVEAGVSQAVDLVVLDVMLPELDGREVCRRIRAKSNVPIIMLTAMDAERDLLEGLEAGADDYIAKPFSALELIGRVRAVLRRRELDREQEQLVRDIGGLRVDLLHNEAEVDGAKVILTPSEFKVLAILTERPGAIFSKRQIMERLWDSPYFGDDHACEVHVSSLRRKIEADPSQPKRLVTVRGRGYMLVA